jgi:hypothetical protein
MIQIDRRNLAIQIVERIRAIQVNENHQGQEEFLFVNSNYLLVLCTH